MKLAVLLCVVGLAVGEWSCERKDITSKHGNICCNDDVRALIEEKMGGESTKAAAVAIRKQLEKDEGGYWEVLVSKADFGFANYMVGSFHCKVTGGDGVTAMAWKVLGGGGGGDDGEDESPKKDDDEPEEDKSEEKSEEKKEKKSSGKTPNELMMECCKESKVDPACYNKAGNKANLCNFNEYNTNSLISHYVGKTCPPEDMGKILLCASSEADHRECCGSQNVKLPLCNLFCNPAGGLRAPKPEEFQCSNSLDKIKKCFIYYKKYEKQYIAE